MQTEPASSLYALSATGLKIISDTVRTDMLYAFDFDGTLAPIVAKPEQARPSQSVVRHMQRLCELVPVAVVSGRRLEDVRERLGFTPQYLIGNHGIEHADGDNDARTDRIMAAWRETLEPQAPRLIQDGILIEDKGLSFSLHYRIARDRTQALATIDEVARTLAPHPKRIGGKLVANFLPPHAPDKYHALQALMAKRAFRAAFFMGDDVTDDLVFDQAPAHWLTIRVERLEGSRAAFYLSSQSEVVTLIQTLIRCLSAHRPRRGPPT